MNQAGTKTAIWRKGADYILENLSIYILTVYAVTS